MLTVNKLLPQGQGLAAVLLKRAASVSLDWDTRQKSRFDATDSAGRHLGVFLPRGTLVRGGDVLVAEDGSLVRVQAAPQPVMVVTPCAEHGSAFDLLRAAYHLGNRHVGIELTPTHLKIEPDHVLAEMLRRMHLTVTEAHEAYEPEGGAYQAGGHGHSHGHAHEHGHDHGGHGHPSHDHHAHDHAPAAPAARRLAIPVVAAPAPHVHGPGCGHDHGHHDHAPAPAKPHVHGPGCGHDH
ncbi:MAG: urease accessory protein UreE [Rubrivivax sp.]